MSDGDEEKPETITTIEALRRRVPSIVKAINADPSLALRAGANPLLALEELGYSLTPELAADVALRVRFDEPTRKRLAELTVEIHRLAGEPFDIDSPKALGRILIECLKLPAKPDMLPTPIKRPAGKPVTDPLAALAGMHPIIAPLLEYRALQGGEPALAPADLYRKLQAGGGTGGVTLRVRAVLRNGPTPG
jgi:hypothetical protein